MSSPPAAVIYPIHATSVNSKNCREPTEPYETPHAIKAAIFLKLIYLTFHSRFMEVLETILTSPNHVEQQKWVQGFLGILLHDVPKLLASRMYGEDPGQIGEHHDRMYYNVHDLSKDLSRALSVLCQLVYVQSDIKTRLEQHARDSQNLWLDGLKFRRMALCGSSPSNILLAGTFTQSERTMTGLEYIERICGEDRRTRGEWQKQPQSLCAYCPKDQPARPGIYENRQTLKFVLPFPIISFQNEI